MRQIFSVILAAALVFGGTLLVAGYFEGVEVRVEKDTEEPNLPDEEREVHYCPQAEDLIHGLVPDHFVESSYLAADITETAPRWLGAILFEPYRATENSVASDNLRCSYTLALERAYGDAWYGLILAPGFKAELDFRTSWKRMEYDDGDQEFIFECEGVVQDCGFFLLAKDE